MMSPGSMRLSVPWSISRSSSAEGAWPTYVLRQLFEEVGRFGHGVMWGLFYRHRFKRIA
jgi:hypothetical protein